MTRKLNIRPEAEVDITRGALWYEGRETGLGTELLSEINAAIVRALVRPEAFLKVRSQPEVRRILVRRFPYRIFYINRDDRVVVFAVLHAARNEKQWVRRVTIECQNG
jgi:plasmid stabilization system protein ParE